MNSALMDVLSVLQEWAQPESGSYQSFVRAEQSLDDGADSVENYFDFNPSDSIDDYF